MLPLLATAGLAAPLALDASVLPPFPAEVSGRVREVCTVELLSQQDGRQKPLGVTGCSEPFQQAVSTRLSWWSWRLAPTELEGLLDPTHVFVAGFAGAPDGLYTRFEVVFDHTRSDEPPTVSFAAIPVVRLRGKEKVTVPADLAPELTEGCDLLLHVEPSGRVERLQAVTCSEHVRAALDPLVARWTFDPLEIEGDHPSYAVRIHVPAR